MSEEQRITSLEKEKDPRRVAAGKRLGAISKAAKERKAREREHACVEECETPSVVPDRTFVIAAIGVTIAGICLYYTYKQDKRASANEDPPKRVDATKPSGSKIRSLD